MSVLVINCGSSSVKFKLIDPVPNHRNRQSGLKGQIERIGTEVPDHEAALANVAIQVKNHLEKTGGSLTAIGHRVVHGGSKYSNPTLIDNDVIDAIDRLSVLAPLHNPANNSGIRAAGLAFRNVPQVAVFDTAYHATIPKAHSTYAVPKEWEDVYGIRRYGFHGTSHQFVSRRCIHWLEKHRKIAPKDTRIIVLHLGNGASACAVAGGKSVDTSMGLTPLPGLVMGTRSGDIDPAVFGHLKRVADLSVEDVEMSLNRESGMVGLCGDSDMRQIEARIEAGDEAADHAMSVYIHRIKSTVGAYVATLGGIDALVFTAGIGENSERVRTRVVSDLGTFGLAIDSKLNENLDLDTSGVAQISSDDSKVAVLVIPTNEELEIATQTLDALQKTNANNTPT
ncbi:MAG: acetate kinase [Pseudomonadota bacterium]